MSKKIPVLNSPWARDYEPPSACNRWIEQGHGMMIDGAFRFTEQFFRAQRRQQIEYDPIGTDDGIERRWTSAQSGGLEDAREIEINDKNVIPSPPGLTVRQLMPVNIVGTGSHVSKRRDELIRRQTRHDPGISISLRR